MVAENYYGDSAQSDEGNGAVIITYPDAPISLTETIASRSPTSITFSWTEGPSNGGSAVLDYRITYDQSTGSFIELDNAVLSTSFTATSLTFGLTYTFRVEARNEFGYSSESEDISILCAAVPVAPLQPTTTIAADHVIFDWAEPVANGKPITGYKIYIRKSDLSYEQVPSVDCDGFDSLIMAETQCLVPFSTMTASPFLLLKGYSVFIKVIAVNEYGDSLYSTAGNGAVI